MAEKRDRARAVLARAAVPLVAVWGASSLAAMWSGREDSALVLGLLLFPILPVTWEVAAWRRRRRAKAQRPRITTLVDRRHAAHARVTLPFSRR